MSGTKQLEQTIVGKHPGEDDADAQRFFNQKIVLPVVQAMRNTMNQLTGDFLSVNSDTRIDVRYGLILVDASAANVTVTLRPPSESHRQYTIVKTDASAHTVLIRVIDGSLMSGQAVLGLTLQWDTTTLVSDDTKYVAMTGPPAWFAVLSPDVTGSLDNNKVVQLQNRPLAATAPVIYQLIRSLDGTGWAPAYEGYPEATGSVTFSLGAGSVDAVAFTVPASPTGIGRYVLQRVFIRLTAALGGADTGTVAVRAGSTVGGNDYVTDQTVDKTTPVGTILTLSAATRGTAMLVANVYEASLAAGDTVNLRATTTGTITAGSATAYVYGAFLP